ncbi:MAG: hypothetical protein H7210_04580 [Pyrinomonadaceae bacterium]|nr:hypothetical protein [Phycisphaerales bacterium]
MGVVTQAIRIVVPRVHLDRATAALLEYRRNSTMRDWSKVDTGDSSPLTSEELAGPLSLCVACQYELVGLVFDSAQRCPECGVLLTEEPPVTTSRRKLAREHEEARAYLWTFRVMVAAAVLAALYMIFIR